MNQDDTPEISFVLWPPKLHARGTAGVRAVAKPLRILLYATAINKVTTRVIGAVVLAATLLWR